MLDRLTSRRKDPAGDTAPATETVQPPILPRIDPAHLPVVNRFYRRRSVWKLQLGARTLRVSTSWLAEEPEIAQPFTICFKVDEEPADLVVPQQLLDTLLGTIDPGLKVEKLSADQLSLLVEFALSDLLDGLEAESGCAVELVCAERGMRRNASPAHPALSMIAQLQGSSVCWCLLRLPVEPMLQLADILERYASPEHADYDLPVPVHLRWGCVTATLSELRSLEGGDILLVDHSTHQPGTAVAVVGEHFAAPVDLLQNGYRVSGALHRARGSARAWSVGDAYVAPEFQEHGAAGDLPIKIFFELGRIELSLRMLRSLATDTVMPLARPLSEGLDIMVGARRIGRGELTSIGEGLGVRVTRINK